MAEKKFGPKGHFGPVDLTHEQVRELVAGRVLEIFEERQRPQDLTPEQVRDAAAGKDIGLRERN